MRTCEIEGCDGKYLARGWCNKHYERWKAHGDPGVVLREQHGYGGTPIYKTWGQMKTRCDNPKGPTYEHYGGRGITYCEAWGSFSQFFADVGERPDDPAGWESDRSYYSLDRIDNDGNYEPGNVRWATWTEQRSNRRPQRRRTTK